MNEIEITFHPLGKKSVVTPPITILEAADRLGIDLVGPCGGSGKCGKCQVKIVRFPRNMYIPPDSVSKQILTESELKKGLRLACTFLMNDSIDVELPPWAYETKYDKEIDDKIIILSKGKIDFEINERYNLDPLIKSINCHLTKPTLDDNVSDLQRLKKSIKEELGEISIDLDKNTNYNVDDYDFSIGKSTLQELSKLLRNENWQLNVVLAILPYKIEILSLRPVKPNNHLYGIALDIGTSTLVAYLIDLASGKEIYVSSMVNPQIKIGADIITRIRYSTQSLNGDRHLNDLLVSGINKLIHNLCMNSNVDASDIFEITIVGNTCMLQNFLGFHIGPLGVAPYTMAFNGHSHIDLNSIPNLERLSVNQNGKLYVSPLISGFLGADAVGLALVTNMIPNFQNNKHVVDVSRSDDNLDNDNDIDIDDHDSLVLALDIGTNGEILLGSKDRICACTAAAGPAFEGGNLRFGMRAVPGAIYNVNIYNKKIQCRTIANKPPIGITGSGVVDAVSEFIRFGAIKRNGNIDQEISRKWLRYQKKLKVKRATEPTTSCDLILPELLLIPRWKSGLDSQITLTQSDIREIQLAKAAIRTGIDILLTELGSSVKKIKNVYLSGAFGNYLNPKSALGISIIPDIPLDKIIPIGNSAGKSAELLLKSRHARKTAKIIADNIEYLDLAMHEKFQDMFIRNMEF